MKRNSYQQGTVARVKRAKGPDVWVLRYSDGEGYRAHQLGTLDKFKTKGAARKEADRKLLEINERIAGIKVSGLGDRLKLEWEKANVELRPHSIETYKSFLKRVRAEWGEWRVDDLAGDILALENWVNEFQTLDTPDRVIPTASPRASSSLAEQSPASHRAQQEDQTPRQGVPAPAIRARDEVEAAHPAA
jgi:hypothetical protein